MAQTTDSSVLSIITAFTSGLDVFRKLRDRRRSRKTRRTAKTATDKGSGEELRLSRSLRRGPSEIQKEYERQVGKYGERYAVGDAIANTSLAQTLIKLNTGLVSIISTFLCSKSNDVQLDYRSLTSLSDGSRLEAIDALNNLSHRIAQPAIVPLLSHKLCPRCGQGKHHGSCERGAFAKTKSVEALGAAPQKEKDRFKTASAKARVRRSVPAPSSDPASKVRKVHLSSASEPQLAIVRSRPKNRRTSSSSSSSSQPSNTTSSRTPPPAYTSPLQSPGFSSPTPTTTNYPPPPVIHIPASKRRLRSQQPSPPQHQPPNTVTLQPIPRRRADKLTPSTFTFASDSTKLGEIPMAKWNMPYDFAEMQRQNAEYYNGRDPTGWEQEERQKKIGLFGRMFRRKKDGKEGVEG